ncbi:hypothetical protein [Methylobacterium planeticum]|uniref:Uncharacterized protein n=1 Tax=Methylobacterium planeticum TaxID=2615211 RepID=A0A6N6MVA3_9HYPH|nr:hypothetical protein [Methylobacterium planeticum]KAB1073637.1 hypothetical protein F6X51_10610 [Methylobacterium planeticum]
MIKRTWMAAKAALGLGLLVIGTLYAAQKLDRERAAQWSLRSPGTEEPTTTGAIVSLARTPGGQTQAPSR